MRGVPYPTNGRQKAAIGLCPDARVAQDLVAGVEGASVPGLRLGSQIGYSILKTMTENKQIH